MRNLFAVQLIVEDTRPFNGYESDKRFIGDMKDTFFEDFPEYKQLSVSTAELEENEAVKELSVYRIEGGQSNGTPL